MKNNFRSISVMLLTGLFITLITVLSCSCKKATTDDPNSGGSGAACWGENWLIGTWEGTTPSTVQPFANTRIRIVFNSAELKISDEISGNPRKVWTYNGTLTWDVGGAGQWSMNFAAGNWPDPDINIILFECVQMTAINQGMANISLRIADTLQQDVYHSIDLDWGPLGLTSSTSATSIDFYGDVEIDNNGTLQRADYVPDESTIRLTKK
ncbi:MAG: hypothetical protein PHP04_03280 [Bacteroidales bacterium]|nr:hypothetical protein [Bacteroidales bacterium]HNW72406.1 hypothetical protein [Bacteroidales bacterium]HPS49469.1 hypothetical protein [Bacteroidales bacterium]